MTDQAPLVSICCITYNHEQFIKDALDGFLIQKTDFPIEVIIHDDASKDKTAEIVRAYQQQYPQLIVNSIFQSRNQFSYRRFEFLKDIFSQARGKYIALCEGDDYWIDCLKLQKQADFLEANSDFSICFHKVKLLKDGQIKEDDLTRIPATISSVNDLAKLGNYIHTPSCMFRNRGDAILGSHFKESPAGDYYLHMMNAQYGKIYCIDEAMAVYRIHEESYWSSKSRVEQLRKFQKVRATILKDLLSSSKEAYVLLANAYISGAVRIYYDFDEKLVIQDCVEESILFHQELTYTLFHKLDDLKATEKIAHRTLLRHFIDAIKKRIKNINF